MNGAIISQRMDMKGFHQTVGSWLKSLARESQAAEKKSIGGEVITREMTKEDESQTNGQSSNTSEVNPNGEEIRCKIDMTPPEPEKPTMITSLMKQSNLDLLTVFLAETIATGLLVFIGCMGCVGGEHFEPNHLTICLTFGLAVMLSLNIFGMVSGAHMNPAVTVAAYIYKAVNIPTALVYMVGQLLGGYLGYGLLRVLLGNYGSVGENRNSFCGSKPNIPGVPAFFLEFLITAILILVACGVWDPRNAKHHDSVPLRFGLTVTVLALIGGPYSGGSMNPARSFGPALYNWDWEYHWLYWAAPMSAAAITALSFRMIFYREPARAERAGEETPLQETKNHV